MGMPLRLPDIKGSDREQLRQIRSYLYQLVPQLQWALDTSAPHSDSADAEKTADSVPGVKSASSARAAAYAELGLSEHVLMPAKEFGRGGAGCRFRADGERVSVCFSCACADSNFPVRVNASLLPEAYRPSAPVRAVCAAEFTDGAHGAVIAEVNHQGEVRVLRAWGGEVPKALDGSVEFCVFP